MRSTSSAISAYETAGYSSSSSRWNPANWTRRIWLAVGTVVVLIVVVVVGAVVGVKATRDNGDGGNSIYPDYFKLNYTLIDTCESCGHVHCSVTVETTQGFLQEKELT